MERPQFHDNSRGLNAQHTAPHGLIVLVSCRGLNAQHTAPHGLIVLVS